MFSVSVDALQDVVVCIDGNLSTTVSVTVVENAVAETVDDMANMGFLRYCVFCSECVCLAHAFLI